MNDSAQLDEEQERARRIGAQLHDARSRMAITAYISELENEKIKRDRARRGFIQLRI